MMDVLKYLHSKTWIEKVLVSEKMIAAVVYMNLWKSAEMLLFHFKTVQCWQAQSIELVDGLLPWVKVKCSFPFQIFFKIGLFILNWLICFWSSILCSIIWRTEWNHFNTCFFFVHKDLQSGLYGIIISDSTVNSRFLKPSELWDVAVSDLTQCLVHLSLCRPTFWRLSSLLVENHKPHRFKDTPTHLSVGWLFVLEVVLVNV